jgi:hypothetical protein
LAQGLLSESMLSSLFHLAAFQFDLGARFLVLMTARDSTMTRSDLKDEGAAEAHALRVAAARAKVVALACLLARIAAREDDAAERKSRQGNPLRPARDARPRR